MLYTTYLANIKNIDDNMKKILVTRWKPRNTIDVKKYNLEWWSSLSPSEILLTRYKNNNITWEEYTEFFEAEMETRKDLKEALDKIENMLKEDKDVVLICYEKDYLHCHRNIERLYFEKKGYKTKEI